MTEMMDDPDARWRFMIRCGNCRFYLDGRPGNSSGGMSNCHRHAPARGEHGKPLWPYVNASDWCGDFEHHDPMAMRGEGYVPL